MIKQFCDYLPHILSQQLQEEYYWGNKLIDYFLEKYPRLMGYIESPEDIKLIYAMSIFHRRIIAPMKSGENFYRMINHSNKAHTITIGSYNLNELEYNKIKGVVTEFEKIMITFGINNYLFDYADIEHFLLKSENWILDLNLKENAEQI